MSQRPIYDFCGWVIYPVNDLGMLFWLIATQEISWPISPAVELGRFASLQGITAAESAASFKRLLEAGEVRWVENERWRGFEVTRFDELHEAMAKFGRRHYFRTAARERRGREKEKSKVAA